MSKKVTFDGAPEPGTINFGVGQPSADVLPVELLRVAADDFLRAAKPIELNYGEKQGDIRFLETLANFLGDGYGAPVTPDSLFVTAAIHKPWILSVPCSPGRATPLLSRSRATSWLSVYSPTMD